MIQQLEMVDVSDDTLVYKDLLEALKTTDLKKFQDILKKHEIMNIDYYFGDPDHGSLLDISCLNSGCHLFVKCLLSHGANPNIVNKIRKKAPLHFAVLNKDFLTIECLLNCDKTDINILDSMGNNPLHLSIKVEELKLVEMLLKYKNININSLNRKGKSALLMALEEKNIDCVKLLLQNNHLDMGSDPNFSKIKELLTEILPEWNVIYKLLPEVSSVKHNKQNVFHYGNAFNLLHSCKYDEFISLLRDQGDNDNFLEINDGSYTFLQYCCEFGLIDIIKELLNFNINPNITTSTVIRTPLMIAAYKGYVDIVKMLIDIDKCTYDPINKETVLHCVVKGSSESPSLGDNNKLKKDHLICLSYLLSVHKCKFYVNFGDLKGNTALHYAARQGEDSMIFQLLKSGASLNSFNMLNEPSFSDISFRTLKEYLDSCIYTNKKLSSEETYEIILNYINLKPVCYHNLLTDNELGSLTSEDHNTCSNCNNFETKALLHLTQNRELKNLLKHPLFTSFLHLKWYKIHKYFCINLLFYLLFWATLTLYILYFYPEFNRTDSDSSTSKIMNFVWHILILLVVLLMFREVGQFCIAPMKYLMSYENWLEIGLITITFTILFLEKESPFQYKVNLSVIGIMLSWSELVLLIGHHPALSTKLEMLRTVSWNFLMFLAWYSFLIAAFAISFYILFGKYECSNVEKRSCTNGLNVTDDDFFRNPGISFFKTVIMLTGEFDASSIPFDERPGISHVLFVAFVFLIAIVLFNLLNGLAVSDIQSIKSDAELVGYISRVKLISYIETLVVDPLPSRNWNKFSWENSNFVAYYKNKFFARHLNIFHSDCLSGNCEIRILPNLGNHVEINSLKFTSDGKESDLCCCKSSNIIDMESSIVYYIKEIVSQRIIENEIKKRKEKKMENEQLLITILYDCQESLHFMKGIITDCKEDILKIKKAIHISD